jgi:hypothetical protein
MASQEDQQEMASLHAALQSDLEILKPLWNTLKNNEVFSESLPADQEKRLKQLIDEVQQHMSADEKKNLKRLLHLLRTHVDSIDGISDWLQARELEEQKAIMRLVLPWVRKYAEAHGHKLPWDNIEAEMQPAKGEEKGIEKKEGGLKYASQTGALILGIDCAVAGVIVGVGAIITGAAVAYDIGNNERRLMWDCQNWDYKWSLSTGGYWLCCYYMCVGSQEESNVESNCEDEFSTKEGAAGVDPDDCGDAFPYHPDKKEKTETDDGKEPAPIPG